jgi:acetyl esterase/lipase
MDWTMLRWLLGLLMLSACSPVSVLNDLAPRAGISETRDIAYAPGDRHGLDIYAPERQGSSAPVIVFIYGGGWKDGNKAEYRFVAAALAAKGFLTVVPDYRLFPEVRFPTFLQDNAAAVAWTKANIARYGGDPHRIFLMGHSAGAYNVAMLTLDKRWLAADGLDPDRDIVGTVGLAGPYDFLPLHDPELEIIFGPAGDLRLTQPITFARGNAPPMLLAAGSADQTVLPSNTEHLAAAIRREGGSVEERLYPGVNHTKIIGAMAGVLRWLAPSMPDVVSFLGRHDGRSALAPAGSVMADKEDRIVQHFFTGGIIPSDGLIRCVTQVGINRAVERSVR